MKSKLCFLLYIIRRIEWFCSNFVQSLILKRCRVKLKMGLFYYILTELRGFWLTSEMSWKWIDEFGLNFVYKLMLTRSRFGLKMDFLSRIILQGLLLSLNLSLNWFGRKSERLLIIHGIALIFYSIIAVDSYQAFLFAN